MSPVLSILASLAFYVPSTILFLAVFWLAAAESDDAPVHEMPGALKDDEAEDFSLLPPTPSFSSSSSSSLPTAQPASPPTGCATTSITLPPPSVSSRDLPSPPSPILPASEISHMVRDSRFVEQADGEAVRKAWQDNKLTFEAVEAVLLGKLSLSEAIRVKVNHGNGGSGISDDDADDGLHTCIKIKPKSSSPEKKNQVTLVRPIQEKLVEDEVDVDGSFVEAFARLQIADEASLVLQPAADDITALVADTLETLERLEALTSFDTSLVPHHPDPHQPAPLPQQVVDDTHTVAEAFESHPVITPAVPQHPVVLPSWVAKLPVGPPASVAFARVLPRQFSVLGNLKTTKKRPSNTRPARHHPYQRSSSRKSVLSVRPRGKFIAKKKGSLSTEPFEFAASVTGDLLDVNTQPYHQEPAPPVMVAQPPQVDDIVSDVVVVSEPAPLAIETEEVVPEQVLTPAPQAIEAQSAEIDVVDAPEQIVTPAPVPQLPQPEPAPLAIEARPLQVDVVVSDVVAEPEQIVTPAPVQPSQPEPAPLVKEAQPTIFDGFKFDVVGVPALSFDPAPVPQFTELVFAPIPVPQLPVPEPAAEAPAALPSPADKELESVAPAPIPQPPQPTPDLPALPALSSQKALPPPESVESIIERASQQLPPAPVQATTPVPAPSPATAPAEVEVSDSDLDLEMALAEERAEAARIAAQADIAAAQEAVRQHEAAVADSEPEPEPTPTPAPAPAADPAPAPAPAPAVALRDFTELDLELALADELSEDAFNLVQADIAAAKKAVEQHNASEATDEPAPAGPAEEKKKEKKEEKAADPLMAALDALEAEEEAEKAKSG
ncbi:hypothetical protein VPNG_08574 [Cytospora leucostoma]|uniref:Uncharacterized protein n=1 Tax=Cytospora leucostoma TaxID=1230097 RepID=A0A423W453_9PEZI|nr:hypothetical protein VPNG_08574 [Cytospora leucostoma]